MFERRAPHRQKGSATPTRITDRIEYDLSVLSILGDLLSHEVEDSSADDDAYHG